MASTLQLGLLVDNSTGQVEREGPVSISPEEEAKLKKRADKHRARQLAKKQQQRKLLESTASATMTSPSAVSSGLEDNVRSKEHTKSDFQSDSLLKKRRWNRNNKN